MGRWWRLAPLLTVSAQACHEGTGAQSQSRMMPSHLLTHNLQLAVSCGCPEDHCQRLHGRADLLFCMPVQAHVSLDPVQHDYLLALLGSAPSSSSRPGANGHPKHPSSTSGGQLVPMWPRSASPGHWPSGIGLTSQYEDVIPRAMLLQHLEPSKTWCPMRLPR